MRAKRWLYTIPLRLRLLFRRDEVEQELEDELCDHLERKTREFAGSGLTAEEARRRVLREFGGVELSKDNCRDARRVNWIQELIQDLRYGVRMLRKSPGFAAVAVVTVALGIGANTALFSVVNGVLLNPLPYPQSKQIVTVANWYEGYGEASISDLNFVDWARLNHSFSAMAASRRASFSMTGRREAVYVTAMEVSASPFPLLGVNATLGRTFSSSEDQLGGAPAIILSGGFWKTKFGGSPEVIGTAVTLDGTKAVASSGTPVALTLGHQAFPAVPS